MNNRVTHFEIPSDKMVDNIDSSMKAIEKAGGKIVVPKRPVPTMGGDKEAR
jgi:predicted enzyme related to lactoylglutathione lyase